MNKLLLMLSVVLLLIAASCGGEKEVPQNVVEEYIDSSAVDTLSKVVSELLNDTTTFSIVREQEIINWDNGLYHTGIQNPNMAFIRYSLDNVIEQDSSGRYWINRVLEVDDSTIELLP